MAFRFESLEVWQIAMDLSHDVHLISISFPKIEVFNLASQIKRAADSVVLNIAEGCTGQTKLEFKRFLGLALRSAVEVVACLFLCRKRTYVTSETFTKLYHQYEILCRMISALRRSI